MSGAKTLRILANMLLALVVFAGVSQQAIAALFCATDNCPKMAMQAKTPKSCCPESKPDHSDSQKEKNDSCCCKIQPTPDAVPDVAKVAVTAPVLVFLDLPVTTQIVVTVVAPTTDVILFEADSSPPDRVALPDRGRAPPVLSA